jgi:hypothetical protein
LVCKNGNKRVHVALVHVSCSTANLVPYSNWQHTHLPPWMWHIQPPATHPRATGVTEFLLLTPQFHLDSPTSCPRITPLGWAQNYLLRSYSFQNE